MAERGQDHHASRQLARPPFYTLWMVDSLVTHLKLDEDTNHVDVCCENRGEDRVPSTCMLMMATGTTHTTKNSIVRLSSP